MLDVNSKMKCFLYHICASQCNSNKLLGWGEGPWGSGQKLGSQKIAYFLLLFCSLEIILLVNTFGNPIHNITYKISKYIIIFDLCLRERGREHWSDEAKVVKCSGVTVTELNE